MTREWPEGYPGAPGSISSGTLKPEDLIAAFLPVLTDLANNAPDALRRSYAANALARALEHLEDGLEQLAPEGFYFAAHEGDGADFGFWPICPVDDEDDE